MSGNNSPLVKNLIALSEVDSKLALVHAERIKLEKELEEIKQAISELQIEQTDKTHAFTERQSYYQREERHLKESQEKLVERRKTLASIGDYKTQMAAEREIEAVSKQLAVQEEALLAVLEQVTELEQAAKAVNEQLETLTSECSTLEQESSETLVNLEERAAEYQKERESLAGKINSRDMTIYRRVHSRFPTDAVVAVVNNACSGCFFEIGPQIIVEISRGAGLVRCRGCKRILYLDDKQEE